MCWVNCVNWANWVHQDQMHDDVHDINLERLTICSFPSSGPARKLILPTLRRILDSADLIMQLILWCGKFGIKDIMISMVIRRGVTLSQLV